MIGDLIQGVGKRGAFNWGKGKAGQCGRKGSEEGCIRQTHGTILSMPLPFRIKKIMTSRLSLSLVNFYNGRRKKKSFLE